MRVDPNQSVFHEDPKAREQFNRAEIRHLRQLLRRLRFLEMQIRKNGGLANGEANGGAAHAEYEHDALEFVLDELEFLLPREN